jgi:hypothetical protein
MPVLAMVGVLAAPSAASAESPRRGAPYRHGLQLQVMAGPTLCAGAGPGGGRCDPNAATRSTPKLGLGGTAGWRFGDLLFLGAGGNLADRRSGTRADGEPAFSDMRTVGAYGVGRLNWALRRTDFSLELGAGWSRQQIAVVGSDEARLLESSGFSLRPALGILQWVVADYAVGVRAEGLFNLHTRYCADGGCGPNVAALPTTYRDVFFHGVIVGVELSALLYLGVTP